jgi:hypothetical protein
MTTKQVRLHNEEKYDMVTLVTPPGVTFEGDMFSEIGNLRYAYHDLIDLKNFPELAPHNNFHTQMNPKSLVITFESKEWEMGLQ